MIIQPQRDLTAFERATIRNWALADARAEVAEATSRASHAAACADEWFGGWYHDLTRDWRKQHYGNA
jgi:hypothetical protein